ncbi:P-loop containing nucleoside triphosphate hydrolase protein [Crucibulum laeve]|uniref:P-loop containing nucleoside triphosphate hydrolase protein n=1 Tax=Crucibulum laeve TaxID=68775 RepID=A0A5C3M5L6_9AGAR|nr:P-loop containing nucleoside triphosphate hydrolase protein [Crucibulum laeve]
MTPIHASWDERSVVPCISILSGLSLLVQWLLQTRRNQSSEDPAVNVKTFKLRDISSGSPLALMRLVGVIVVASCFAVRFFDCHAVVNLYMTCSMVYILCLLLAHLLTTSLRTTRQVYIHARLLLFAVFTVDAIRNVWPLTTYTQSPKDLPEGQLLWVRLGAVTISGVIIPLVIRSPLSSATRDEIAEETASLWSRLTYGYLNATILTAFRKKTLLYSDLPHLRNVNHARNLVRTSFPTLDVYSDGKNKSKSLLWNILTVFRWEYVALAVLQAFQICLGFVGPLTVNRILTFMEGDGRNSIMQAWFWVSLLFLGPFIRALVSQWYTFISTRNVVRLEAILTQLIFSHSLRIRMNDPISQDLQEGPKTGHLVGRINNLVTSDLSNITSINDIWLVVLFSPFQIALSTWFLYVILGWSAFSGLAVMLACFPMTGYFTRMLRNFQISTMKKSDARVQKVAEALAIIRMIKLFGWEPKITKQITTLRDEEVALLKKSKKLELASNNYNYLIPLLTMMMTFGTYTALMHRELTSSRVFSSIAVFENLRLHLRQVLSIIPNVVQGKVSLDRVNDFFIHSEILRDSERVTPQSQDSLLCAIDHQDKVGFLDTEFFWSSDDTAFKLRIHGLLLFEPGITLIVGPTSSGKSSILLALLGEMRHRLLHEDSWFHLPRGDGVAYVPQKSWILSSTVKENIVFGSNFDKERYEKVVRQCALSEDLTRFEDGDATEVGERGIMLSGGQKARISLARAIYSTARVVLIDDVLASVDARTANLIVSKCLLGDLMIGRTVLLVSHNLALSGISQRILHISLDGHTGPDYMVSANSSIPKQPRVFDESTSSENDIPLQRPMTSFTRRLIVSEAVDEGHIQWTAFKLYLTNLSRRPTLFWIVILGAIFSNEFMLAFQSWFLGYWSAQYETNKASEVSISYYLGMYTSLMAISIALYSASYTLFYFGSLRASRVIHRQFIVSVLNCMWRWLDTTPTSRIIARATQDMRIIDGPLALSVKSMLDLNLGIIVRIGSIGIISPIYILPGVFVACAGIFVGQLYMTAQLSVKRHMSNAKSPVLGHFAVAMEGIVSIRAYGVQARFLDESLTLLDLYTRAAVIYWDLNRWVTIRSEVLGGIFTAGLGAYLVYWQAIDSSASNTGFSLTMAVGFSSMILTWIRMLNNAELSANSLERVLQYTELQSEEDGKAKIMPPAHWPASGALRVEKLSARYSEDEPEILRDISFEIKSGEHVGIVGRTGAGKSSLALSLMRCIPTKGDVYYDEVLTTSISISTLRANISIIPQDPDLLTGSLRENLDPFSEHDDSDLYDALRSAGFFNLESGSDGRQLSLDTQLSSGGNNLSVGQRQIVALARTLVRGSKLLILDEATSAIDYKTDSVIQTALRHELDSVTLLTVAHRLQTIMDFDRIMVLDAGRIIEFDKPSTLLQMKQGLLRALVDESPDRESLYAMAGMQCPVD